MPRSSVAVVISITTHSSHSIKYSHQPDINGLRCQGQKGNYSPLNDTIPHLDGQLEARSGDNIILTLGKCYLGRGGSDISRLIPTWTITPYPWSSPAPIPQQWASRTTGTRHNILIDHSLSGSFIMLHFQCGCTDIMIGEEFVLG